MQKVTVKKQESKEPSVARIRDPFDALRRSIDRVFEEFRSGSAFEALPAIFGERHWGDVHLPRLDVAETDDEVLVSADLPGVDEKDVEVTIGDHSLTIRGEKSSESEEKKRNYHVKERAYGSFQRVVVLPEGINIDGAKATFKKGVLKVAIPKTREAKANVRKVEVQVG